LNKKPKKREGKDLVAAKSGFDINDNMMLGGDASQKGLGVGGCHFRIKKKKKKKIKKKKKKILDEILTASLLASILCSKNNQTLLF
jgi:hypothetical protein